MIVNKTCLWVSAGTEDMEVKENTHQLLATGYVCLNDMDTLNILDYINDWHCLNFELLLNNLKHFLWYFCCDTIFWFWCAQKIFSQCLYYFFFYGTHIIFELIFCVPSLLLQVQYVEFNLCIINKWIINIFTDGICRISKSDGFQKKKVGSSIDKTKF